MVSEIARAVNHERKARGWSQEHLGGLAGTDQTTISQVERGKFHPTYPLVLALADAFGVDRAAWVQMAGYELAAEPPSEGPATPLAEVVAEFERELRRVPGFAHNLGRWKLECPDEYEARVVAAGKHLSALAASLWRDPPSS